MSAPTFPSFVLRFLMLALLVAGMLVRPVMAVECEIRDAQQSVAGDLRSAEPEAPCSNEDCCSLANCNDCCAPTIALQPLLDGAPALPVAAPVVPALSVDFEPIAFPVPFRPPIAA